MQIAVIQAGAVAKVGDYRELFPSTSFPYSGPSDAWMSENSCVGVTVFKPHDRATEKLVPVEPYIENGQCYTVAVQPKTAEEIDAATASQAAQVRSIRNRLLSECDWTQLPDSTANQQAWANYRQQLRDISSQPGFPGAVEWPHDPNWVEPTPL